MKNLGIKTLIFMFCVWSTNAFACSEASIQAINNIANGLSTYTNPTVANARAIIAIGMSCNDSRVKTRAAQVLRYAISSYSNPTAIVAEDMVNLCGRDQDCAIAAINSLSKGITNYTNPTVTIADAIVRIVYQAPFQRVKEAAISALSNCISSYTHPTYECSAALVQVGSCKNID